MRFVIYGGASAVSMSEAGERLESVQAILDRYSVHSHPVKRILFLGLGGLFVVFAVIGIWVPGWPTVSWAVPAAFFFSLSSRSLFEWTLTNRWFGAQLFEYYATGKTVPKHAKLGIAVFILLSTLLSAYGVWAVSTRGDGTLLEPATWDGADPDSAPRRSRSSSASSASGSSSVSSGRDRLSDRCDGLETSSFPAHRP